LFSEDLLKIRDNDKIESYIDNIFKAFQVVPGVTYLGYRLITDHLEFPEKVITDEIQITRVNLLEAKFRLDFDGEEKDVVIYQFIPQLMNHLFYQINGNLFYPILQLVDRSTYCNSKRITLKTLLLPVCLRLDTTTSLTTVDKQVELSGLIYTIDIFKSETNILLYFFSKMGLEEGLKFFDMIDYVAYSDELIDDDSYYCFQVSKTNYLYISKEYLNEEDENTFIYKQNMVLTLHGALRMNYKNDVFDQNSWVRKLGAEFTNNSTQYEEKTRKITVSLERVLDQQTKINLAHVAEEDKENIYALLRWIMRNMQELRSINHMNILEKRIRVAEYVIHPLLLKFSDATYRFLNSRNMTMKTLFSAFKAFTLDGENEKHEHKVSFLIDMLGSNDLLRYVNLVNSFDLLLALKWTSRGPQGVNNGKSDISVRYRGHHPSYVGRISLVAASAGDPGVSGSLVPFVKLDGFYFK
jgi:hypothetical protein